jgi:hypothetical protein
VVSIACRQGDAVPVGPLTSSKPWRFVQSRRLRIRDSPGNSAKKLKEVYLQRDPGEALDFCPIVANEEWLGRADLNDPTDAQFTQLPEQLLTL